MTNTIELDIPADMDGWRRAWDRALDIYWRARRNGSDENEALRQALDDALRDTVARR